MNPERKPRFLVQEFGSTIYDDNISEWTQDQLARRISWLDKTINIGIDIHAGFYFPDLEGLRYVIASNPPIQFNIHPALIDERGQSGNFFSPVHVYTEKKGRVYRRRIADSDSTYVSQTLVDVDRIEKAYIELIEKWEGSHEEHLLRYVRENNPDLQTLGEFLMGAHNELIKRQLQDCGPVRISEMRFDRYDPGKGYTDHREETHNDHDVVYIGLAKDPKFVFNKFNQLAIRGRGNLKLVIVPMNPRHYFSRGGYI